MATQLAAWVYSFADPLLRDRNRLLPYTSNYHTLSYISFDLVTKTNLAIAFDTVDIVRGEIRRRIEIGEGKDWGSLDVRIHY